MPKPPRLLPIGRHHLPQGSYSGESQAEGMAGSTRQNDVVSCLTCRTSRSFWQHKLATWKLSTYLSSKGCCLNPKGWCMGTLYHPFSTLWKIQVYMYIHVLCIYFFSICIQHTFQSFEQHSPFSELVEISRWNQGWWWPLCRMDSSQEGGWQGSQGPVSRGRMGRGWQPVWRWCVLSPGPTLEGFRVGKGCDVLERFILQ